MQSGLPLWKVLWSRHWQTQLMGPFGPMASFANKVLLVHSSVDASSVAALCQDGRVAARETLQPREPEILSIWPLQKAC